MVLWKAVCDTFEQTPSQNAVPFHICALIAVLRAAACSACLAASACRPSQIAISTSVRRPRYAKAFATELYRLST